MKQSKSSEKDHRHFFANETDYGIHASFSNTQGRKNYIISKVKHTKEEIPLAIESFAISQDKYHSLMERVYRLYD